MKRNALEWLVLIASLLAVVGLVGFLLVDGLADSNEPPSIRLVVIDEGTAGAHGWLVPLTIHNEGARAAAGVTIEGTADVNGIAETSELTVDLLAADSQVGLTLGFSGQPQGEIDVRVVGFEIP